MRVLQLGKFYDPVVGGIETHLRLLAEGLVAAGIDVEVVVHNTRLRTVRDEVRGVRVTRVASLGRLMSADFSPGLVRELSRPYDVLHLHTPHPVGMLAYILARKPPRHALVVTHHSDIVKQVRLRTALSPLFRAVMSRANAVITTSRRYAASSEDLERYQEKIRVVPLGIDLSRFQPALRSSDEARELRQRYGPRIVLGVGRLTYYKGFDVLIAAMKSVCGHLLLVGDGSLRRELQIQAEATGVADRVTFLGNVPDIGAVYGSADVFVLPSTARSEAFGIVQLEAMSVGLPVVNTAIDSGVPEVSIDGATGFTVRPNSPTELAGALNRLLDDDQLRASFGANARQRAVERFTAERMVEETVALYESVRQTEDRVPAAVVSA